MKAYVMDAFTETRFSGNQAGVVFLSRPLDDETMRLIAAEFKHSETAFVSPAAGSEIPLLYFTPAGEVPLCGHATVAAFSALRLAGRIGDGEYTAVTKAGKLAVSVNGVSVLMDMARPELLRTLSGDESARLYAAYGLSPEAIPEAFPVRIVSTGLADIMLPVSSREILLSARQNEAEVSELSREFGCVGVHMFAPGEGGITAFCSNFAPLYGIPEECATGTANAALTYYLYLLGRIRPGETNVFLQGEHMGRPCRVESILTETPGGPRIRIGGCAAMSMSCEIMI